MSIKKWQKILITWVIIYCAIIYSILSNQSICFIVFDNIVCGHKNRYEWFLLPTILLTVFCFLWEKEISKVALNIKNKIKTYKMFIIKFCFVCIGCMLLSIIKDPILDIIYPSQCSKRTAIKYLLNLKTRYLPIKNLVRENYLIKGLKSRVIFPKSSKELKNRIKSVYSLPNGLDNYYCSMEYVPQRDEIIVEYNDMDLLNDSIKKGTVKEYRERKDNILWSEKMILSDIHLGYIYDPLSKSYKEYGY